MLYRLCYCLLLENIPYIFATPSSVMLASCPYTTDLFFLDVQPILFFSCLPFLHLIKPLYIIHRLTTLSFLLTCLNAASLFIILFYSCYLIEYKKSEFVLVQLERTMTLVFNVFTIDTTPSVKLPLLEA